MKNVFKNTHASERTKMMHKIKNWSYSTILNNLLLDL